MNGLDFELYIEYVMERLVVGERDVGSLLLNYVYIPRTEFWIVTLTATDKKKRINQ